MQTEKQNKVRVSVIVPVRNESRYLARCLQSILANDFPKDDFEVLVVDGMSEDDTRQVTESFKKMHPALWLIENPKRIAPTALNLGIQKARGDIVIRIDGHGEVAPDFIRRSVEALEKISEAGCVGGNIQPQGDSFMSRVIALAQGSLFGGGGGAWYRFRKAGFTDTVLNAAYRHSVFEKVGFFDETLVRDQDDEFNYRLRQAGYKIYFDPQIHGIYHVRGSLSKLVKQYFQYGFWKVKVFRKRAPMIRPRQFVAPLFAAVIFLFTVASVVSRTAKFALWLLAGMYFASSFIASGVIGIRMGWRFTFALPLAFGAMHLGYGFGFWTGLFYFTVIQRRS